MIFVTTGTQEPFDRLIAIVEKLSFTTNEKIVVQAKTAMKLPSKVEIYDFLSPKEYDYFFNNARLIISHAGMGSIISALYKSRPIVVFPRIASLGEHRNEHQLATAKKMKEENMVRVAFSEEELLSMLEDLVKQEIIEPLSEVGPFASNQLIKSLDELIRH